MEKEEKDKDRERERNILSIYLLIAEKQNKTKQKSTNYHKQCQERLKPGTMNLPQGKQDLKNWATCLCLPRQKVGSEREQLKFELNLHMGCMLCKWWLIQLCHSASFLGSHFITLSTDQINGLHSSFLPVWHRNRSVITSYYIYIFSIF